MYMGAVQLILAAADIMWVDNCSTKPYVLMLDLAVGVLKALSAHSNARLFRCTLHILCTFFCCAPPVLKQGVLERSHLWKTIKLSLWLPFVVSLSCGRSDKHDTSRCGFLCAHVRSELCSPVWVALVFESVLSSMRWIPFFFFFFFLHPTVAVKTHNNSVLHPVSPTLSGLHAVRVTWHTRWNVFEILWVNPTIHLVKCPQKAEAKVYPGHYKLMRVVALAACHHPTPPVKGPFLLSPVGQICLGLIIIQSKTQQINKNTRDKQPR